MTNKDQYDTKKNDLTKKFTSRNPGLKDEGKRFATVLVFFALKRQICVYNSLHYDTTKVLLFLICRMQKVCSIESNPHEAMNSNLIKVNDGLQNLAYP